MRGREDVERAIENHKWKERMDSNERSGVKQKVQELGTFHVIISAETLELL